MNCPIRVHLLYPIILHSCSRKNKKRDRVHNSNLKALARITSCATSINHHRLRESLLLAVLVVRLAVENAQNGEEKVDDVEVQADGGGNLLLDMVVAHDHLRVDEDVAAKDESCKATVDELAGGAVRQEHGHESEDDEAPQSSEQVGHPRCKVILGLAGKDCEEDEDACGEDGGVEDDGGLVEGDDDGDGVCFGEGEEREEEQVGRVGLALPVGETHKDHGAEELESREMWLAKVSLR